MNIAELNSKVPRLEKLSGDEIYREFLKAYKNNPHLAMKWLLYVRDIKKGLGRRKIFQEIIKRLAWSHPDECRKIIPIIVRVGRWDDVLSIIWVTSAKDVGNIKVFSLGIYAETFIHKQLELDLHIAQGRCDGKVSLLAKWMPSINASSEITKAHARYLAKSWGISERKYRKTLSYLRKHLEVVETKMCAGEWNDIVWSDVPSQAKSKYHKSFTKHSELTFTVGEDNRGAKNYITNEKRLKNKLNSPRYNL